MGLILARPRGGTGQITKEPATEVADGIITDFTTQSGNYLAGSLSVFLNGVREGYATELGGNQFRITPAPRAGFKVHCEFILG